MAVTATKTDSQKASPKTAARTTRLLLALWDAGGRNIGKGKVTDRVKIKGEKSADCEKFFVELEKEESIIVERNKVSITEKGIEQLGQGLKNADLGITATIVGAWMAKALLKWIQQSEATMNSAATNGKAAHSKIGSYEEFKQVVLEVFDRLDRDYNLDNLVPIYRIRRAIGEQVSRSHFNEWMLNLQADDLLQLIGGEMPSLTPDIAEDSIETKLGGVRYYAKKL
ncbi:MAG: hypothetical protein HC881_13425 [Leptolyngbyaceae cyanobacterium SL_7_1]|nr:hypothetical protein [Leptolyngbyaceae cyanobacterium SL_7_1]